MNTLIRTVNGEIGFGGRKEGGEWRAVIHSSESKRESLGGMIVRREHRNREL